MDNKEVKNNVKVTTKTNHVIRAMLGAYLVYLGYSLIDAIQTHVGTEQIVYIGFTLLFFICGGLLLGVSLWSLKKGKYDTQKNEEEV